MHPTAEMLNKFGISVKEMKAGPRGGDDLVVWFHFTQEDTNAPGEMKEGLFDWKIGFRRVDAGIQIYDGDVKHSLGLIDLFYRACPTCSSVSVGPHSQYVIDTCQTIDEVVGVVKYLPKGTIVSFDRRTEIVGQDKYGGDVWGYRSTNLTTFLKKANEKTDERKANEVPPG